MRKSLQGTAFSFFLGFTNCKNMCIAKSFEKPVKLVDPLYCNTDFA